MKTLVFPFSTNFWRPYVFNGGAQRCTLTHRHQGEDNGNIKDLISSSGNRTHKLSQSVYSHTLYPCAFLVVKNITDLYLLSYILILANIINGDCAIMGIRYYVN